jgi:hypothetical protein
MESNEGPPATRTVLYSDGTLNALITTDLGLTRMAFGAAGLNTKSAIDLFGQRKIRPANPDDYNSS